MKHVQRWLHDPESQIAAVAFVAALVVFLISVLLSGCQPPGSPAVTSPTDLNVVADGDNPPTASPERPDFEVLTIKGSGTFRFAIFGQPIDVEVGAAGSDTTDACVRVSFRYGLIEASVDHPKGCTNPKPKAQASPSPASPSSSSDATP